MISTKESHKVISCGITDGSYPIVMIVVMERSGGSKTKRSNEVE